MLNRIRDNKNNTIISVIVGLIVVVFIFWGSSSGQGQKASLVARVNGSSITQVEFAKALGRRLEQMRRYSNHRASPVEEAMARKAVLDSLIEAELLRQEAERLHVVASDEELRAHILDLPYFNDDNGKFDQRAYKRTIRRYPMFEQEQRESLVFQKLEALVRESVDISDADLKELFERENTKVNVEYLKLAYSRFGNEYDITPEERQKYIEEHNDDVQARYDRDFNRLYNIAKKVRARHILLKFEEDDDGDVKAAAREKMRQIQELAKTEDFAELAKEYSEDPGSTARGGDLGLFDEKQMDPAFSEAAFSLGVGEISGVVESSFGLHLIKVEEIQEARVKTVTEVQDAIADDLIREAKGPVVANQIAEEIRPLWSAGGETLKNALDKHKLTVNETGLISVVGHTVRGIGSSHDLATSVLSLPEGAAAPGSFDVGSAQVFVRVKERKQADAKELETKKDRLEVMARRQKEEKVMDAWIEHLKSRAVIEMLNPRALEPSA